MNNIRPRHLSTDESARGALWVGYSGLRCKGIEEEKEDDEEEECVDTMQRPVIFSPVCERVSLLPPTAAGVTAHISDSSR